MRLDQLDPATATILGGVITSAVVGVLNYLRESRAHQWAREQSELDRQERLATAAELKSHHARESAKIAEVTTAVLSQKIDENTEINVAAIAAGEKAFTEANNLSLKMQQQGLQLRKSDRLEGV